MPRRKFAGSGGIVERLIFILMGFVLASIGSTAAMFCYWWATDTTYLEHRWLYVAISGACSFLMLRAALYTVFPEDKEEQKFRLSNGGW